MATTYLERSISSTGNRQIMTFSAWIKRATAGATNCIFSTGTGAARDMILFESDGKLQFSKYNGSYSYQLKTNRQFRDLFGWYHLVCVLDTTESSSTDRAKIYVNGVQETSLATSDYPTQDYNTNYNTSGNTQYLGQDSDGSFDFDGCMSHVHYIDGTAYAASTFGETDATTGEWKIKTSPTVTYGTNGFFLLKNDASLTDQGTEGNNFTLGAGTLTKTEDSPSNVFATLNPLNRNTNVTFSNGANTLFSDAGTGGTNYRQNISTLGMSKGKFYAEVKCSEVSAGSQYGVVDITQFTNNRYIGYTSRGYGYMNTGEYYNNGSSVQGSLSTFSNPDIISIAFDADNSNVYFRKNGGAWENSGDPTSGSTGTGALAVTSGHVYAFGCSGHGANPKHEFNFGNGYFGTTAISSEGTNASGVGKFEYDVPTGYTALSTKGMNI